MNKSKEILSNLQQVYWSKNNTLLLKARNRRVRYQLTVHVVVIFHHVDTDLAANDSSTSHHSPLWQRAAGRG